jgi:predicted lactoylglutathione lyase
MTTAIYINLPVRDLRASIDFFTKTGFAIEENFTGDDTGCVVIGPGIYAFLLTEPFFKDNSQRELVDTATHCEAILAVQVDTRARVDELVDAAIANGGESTGDAMDEGFMYSRGFRDLDGHQWNVLQMELGE